MAIDQTAVSQWDADSDIKNTFSSSINVKSRFLFLIRKGFVLVRSAFPDCFIKFFQMRKICGYAELT